MKKNLFCVLLICSMMSNLAYSSKAMQSTPSDYSAKIFYAIERGDINFVKEYIETGGDPNICDKLDRSLLVSAYSHGKYNIVDYLLTCKNIDISLRNNNGMTIGHLAVSLNDRISLQKFIQHGLSINAVTTENESLLYYAYNTYKNDIVDYLFTQQDSQEKINISLTCTKQNSSPIGHIAIVRDDKAMLQKCIQHGLSVNSNDGDKSNSLISFAYHGDHLSIVDYLLKQTDSSEPIDLIYLCKGNLQFSLGHAAIHANDLTYLKKFIRYGLSVKSDSSRESSLGFSLLHMACEYKNQEIIDYLLIEQADNFLLPDPNERLTGHIAVGCNNIGILKKLLTFAKKKGLKNYINTVDRQGCSMLKMAIENNNIEAVKVLIDHDANIFLRDASGWSAIDCIQEAGSNIVDEIKEVIHQRQIEPFEALVSSHRVIAKNICDAEEQGFSEIVQNDKKIINEFAQELRQQQEAEKKQKYSYQKKLLELDEQAKRQQLSSQNEYEKYDMFCAYHKERMLLAEVKQRAEIAQEEYMLWLNKKNQQGILTGIMPTFLRGIVRVAMEKSKGTKISKQEDDALKKMTIQELIQKKSEVLSFLSQEYAKSIVIQDADLASKALKNEENLHRQQMCMQKLVEIEVASRKNIYTSEEAFSQQVLQSKYIELFVKQRIKEKYQEEYLRQQCTQQSNKGLEIGEEIVTCVDCHKRVGISNALGTKYQIDSESSMLGLSQTSRLGSVIMSGMNYRCYNCQQNHNDNQEHREVSRLCRNGLYRGRGRVIQANTNNREGNREDKNRYENSSLIAAFSVPSQGRGVGLSQGRGRGRS